MASGPAIGCDVPAASSNGNGLAGPTATASETHLLRQRWHQGGSWLHHRPPAGGGRAGPTGPRAGAAAAELLPPPLLLLNPGRLPAPAPAPAPTPVPAPPAAPPVGGGRVVSSVTMLTASASFSLSVALIRKDQECPVRGRPASNARSWRSSAVVMRADTRPLFQAGTKSSLKSLCAWSRGRSNSSSPRASCSHIRNCAAYA